MENDTLVTEAGTDISGVSFADLRKMIAGEEVTVPEVTESSEVAEAKPAAESTAAESDTAETEGTETGEEEKPKTQSGINKKFHKLTTKIRDLEARLATKPAAIEVKQAVTTPEPAKELVAPKQEDFKDWEDYQAAFVRHELKVARAEEAKAESDRTAAAAQSALEERLTKMVAAAAVKHPDFDAVALNPKLPVTDVMLHVMQSSDNGAELLYHLGSNPDVSAKIAAMSPGAAALAIGKLEAKLFPDEAPKPVTPIVVPKVLPKPPSTVGNTAVTAKALTDEMPYSEFKSLFNKEVLGKK